MFSTIGRDLGFAVRQFHRHPMFTLAAVFTLALGIATTTAVFSLFDAILLRPLAFRDSDRLVAIDTLEFPPGVAPTNLAAANQVGSSYPNFFDWRQQNHTFESLASCDAAPRLFSQPNGDGARVLTAARVSANLFSTLGVEPALGRTFTAEEEQAGHRVVILSHDLWVSDFASSPKAIGQTVNISDEASTIIGVMPSGFHYPVNEPASFWTTFAADNEGTSPRTSLRWWDRLSVVGRLKRGVEIKGALADLNAIQHALAQQYSEDKFRLGVSVAPLLAEAVSDVHSVFSLLLAAVAVLLVIACANVAGLLLVRAEGRRPELSLRTALGASRRRVFDQLLLEALLLALAGGTAGIFGAFGLLRIGVGSIPSAVPRLYNVTVNGRMLLFGISLSAATALLFGLLPAWRMSQLAPATALREVGPGMTSSRKSNRLHQALVILESALSFTLLIAAGLLIRSAVNILSIKPGFDSQHTLSFDIALTNKRYPDPSKVPFFANLLPKLAALPGVERASAGHPSSVWTSFWATFSIPGHLYSPDNLPGAVEAVAEPGYFETLSIPLLRGRTFTQHDDVPKAAPVAIINESLARLYFPAEDPIGRYLVPDLTRYGEQTIARQIIGIVGNTRSEDPDNPYQPEFFLPYAQNPNHQRPLVVLKVRGDPLSYGGAVRAAVASIDKDTPVFDYRTFSDDIQMLAAQPHFQAVLLSSFSGIALLLSAVGLYAVLSYAVAQKTHELALRMALGASPSDLLLQVLYRGFSLACTGVLLGALASTLATKLIKITLFRVAPVDPWVFLTVTLVLTLVSLLAALAPALRAAKLDPMRTLREQ